MIPVLAELVAEAGLSERVAFQPAGCMSNCIQGVSIRVMPGNVRYGNVKLRDLPEIVEQHFGQGKPVERLVVAPVRRFSSF